MLIMTCFAESLANAGELIGENYLFAFYLSFPTGRMVI